MGIYREPLYYDIAFSWDLESEVSFLKSVFEEFAPFPVERVLEPACGTGRFLRALPKHGFHVTGYDNSPAMVEFTRASVGREGLASQAQVLEADMRDARFGPPFDASLNSINSFCYLVEDDDVGTHLACMADSLRPGGVYVLHFSMARASKEVDEGSSWEMERDGVSVVTHWSIESEDAASGVGTHLSRLEVEAHGERRTIEDRHRLRAWTDEAFRETIRSTGTLELVGLFGDGYDYERMPVETRVVGEMGNHYYILQRRA